ncbi:Hypothetical protein PHPALM_15156 [Phytophthora palmivora]|uniref:MYCBP-associated protein n=1 Tax=Phytophthora palmivora TaxID=4796 RepID=A0A2P4XSV8_9STRA|nr:Hypothetical protein PHPALM_15156 [Phytophthora palmivora]
MPAATGHNSAVSMVVNQHHSRDARSGKLASYAALGGAEDVERFDKFLAEQRGQPSASELRAAATSPHHVAASMKRRTMSRIQLEGIDGKLSNAEPAGDAVTRKLMQQELENDARKRREEAVAHRKWLNSLPIHERVAQQRQRNALRKWRQMSRDWETFKARAARKLGKTPQELVMSRASTYREQREMYDTLQKARPLNDKVGEDIWLVSLRDEGTRYVPVGNIFSGLFCPIRESTKIGPRVRRPLDYYNSKESHPHEISRPMSKLEKRSLNLLERKKWRLRKQLEILQPHEVDRSATTHLSVKTSDLFAWASGGTNESNVDGDNELSVQAYSAGIDEVSRGQRQRSYASPSSPMSVVKEGSPFSGPSLQIAYVTDADEEPISNPESNGALVGKRPETCLPPLHLSFYTTVDEQVQRSLSITNDGSTVVHYQWWRAPFEDENADLTIHLRGNYTRKEEQESERFWTTSVSKLGGTILPQETQQFETQQFVFTFESSKAGVFLEKWLLDADPQPRICLGTTRVGTDMDSVELPVEVRLSCVAEDNFVGRNKRKLQLTRVEQKEGRFFVANLVDEILDGVKPPEPKVFNELSPREDVTKFYEKNDCNEFSDVYFSSDLVRDCRTLYERAQGILRALSPVKDLVIEEENLNENDALDSGGAEGVEKPNEVVSTEQSGSTDGLSTDTKVQQETTKSAPLPAYLVEEWDWRLETLCELCKMADEAQNLHIGQLTEQLKKEIEEVEEEEENEDDDEDEIDDAEEDDDEEGARNEGSSADKSPRISPREQRKIERLARRKAIEDEIGNI